MNDKPVATVRRTPRYWRISPVWLVPLAAALIGLWLAYRTFLGMGPEIVLELPTAEGLEAGKTTVKLNNVDVGRVHDVKLSANYGKVVATIRMEPEAAPLLVEDTQFWVVKPRVTRRGVSGLQTIISGAYIQIQPGDSRVRARRFAVPKQPPATRANVPGLSLTLTSADGETLAIGDPVFFQGQSVGQVTAANFDFDARVTRYSILVESPYDQLVGADTQFWLRSGLDARLTSEGLDLELGSLQTLLAGGVTFGMPAQGNAEPASDGDVFELFGSRDAAYQARFDQGVEYLVLVDGSVRGLHAGAPVELRGVRVGTVVEAPFLKAGLLADSLRELRIPVLIRFEPQRLGDKWSGLSRAALQRRLESEFDHGLRAAVSTGNLLTGATYVNLRYIADAGAVASAERAGYPLFPTHAGGALADLQTRLSALLDKLNALPVESTLSAVDGTLASADQALASMTRLLESEAMQTLPAELRSTLTELKASVASYQQGQPVHDALLRALQRLNQVLDDLAPFVEAVRQRPSSLIFGIEPKRDPIPRARQ